MSDEEEQYSDEEEEIEEGGGGDDAPAEADSDVSERKASIARRPPPKEEEVDETSMTEAGRAMLEAKKRAEKEAEMKLQDYESRRLIDREKEEEELRLLKQRQEERKKQREEEEREFAERMKKEEEKRKAEEESRRNKMEAEKRRREEDKMKRQAMMAGFGGTGGDGPNFKIEKGAGKADKFSNIVQAKQEMKMTKEQQEEAKSAFLAIVARNVDITGMLPNDLKEAIKKLHAKISKLEADKYDLEKRHERQDYDLKELAERQRQANRNKALQKGDVDPTETNSRFPPKVSMISRFDRQIDRRGFRERRALFDKQTAVPHFPNVPPPPTILEFKIAPEANRKAEEDMDYDEEE